MGAEGLALGDVTDRTLVADLRDLWLPDELQQQSYGRRLVQALVSLWRELGIEQARATAVTDAGKAAFAACGWSAEPPDVNDHVEYWLDLGD